LLLLHHLLLHEGLRRRPNTEYKERVVASACSLYANKISLPPSNRDLRKASRELTLKLVYCGCKGCCCWFQPTSTKF
jgi:hypothetical protein